MIPPRGQTVREAAGVSGLTARDGSAWTVYDDLGVEVAAEAVIQVANVKMANALRVVSVEKGHDPREFVQVGFGGAGPQILKF